MLNVDYHYLDLVPKGRDEGERGPFWVRRHDGANLQEVALFCDTDATGAQSMAYFSAVRVDPLCSKGHFDL